MAIAHPDQVWSADIASIQLLSAFVYLVVAVMDWYSHYVLSWALSTTQEKDFCLQALQEALATLPFV